MAESDLIRGNVDTIILKVLYEGDRYGYDLIKQINARGDGQWEIKQPTVYACLKRLEKQGFISSYWDSSESDGGRRKYYSLTDSGKEVFLRYKSEFERANALFGELITGSEPEVFLHPEDDYSDVEDEGYALPKRRSAKRAKKSVERSTENTVKTENNVLPQTQAPLKDNTPVSEQTTSEQSEPTEPSVSESQEIDVNGATDAETKSAETDMPATPALDPRAIIESIYATEKGESYSDAHKRSDIDATQTVKYTPPPAPIKAVAPAPAPLPPTTPASAPVTAPAPVRNAEPPVTAPLTDKQVAESAAVPPAPAVYTAEEESDARREYQTVLGDLVERFEMASPDIRRAREESPVAEEQAATAATDYGALGKVEQAVRELGNDVKIRNHNDSAKEYAKNNYYFSNRLWLMHYTVLCTAMFFIGLVLFVTFVWGLHIRIKYDYLLYIFAGLLPVVMILTAVTAYATDQDKVKRINVNYKASMIIRFVIMAQVAVIVYCLNLMWGMPVGFSADYIPTLVLPCAYALFIPISEVIYINLLRSGNYANYRE